MARTAWIASFVAFALVGASGVLAAPAPEGRPPAPELVQKGEAIFNQSCAVCHGQAARGGPGGAPDLTASAIAMANDGGAGLAAFLQVGRPDKGMPARPVTEEEGQALSAKLRSLGFAAAGVGQGAAAPAPVLVGDAEAGRRYFNGAVGRCYTCHAVSPGAKSSAPNLSGIAGKYPDPKRLQNNMILPERRYFWSPANSDDVTATVIFKDGRRVQGLLNSVSDFKVFIRGAGDKEQVFERKDGEPKVVLVDRLQHHLDLLRRYRDSDIHDLTAYLATLK